MKQLFTAFALAALAATASGCIIDATATSPIYPGNNRGGATLGSGRAPIIQAFTHAPMTAVTKDDTITFTVVASDMENDVLQYNWSATKGLLTGNSGQVVAWKPSKADGSFETGIATVNVIISDGRQTTTGAVNIMIAADGKATVTTDTAPASTAPTAAPSATPTAAPSTSPTAAPTATPTADVTASPSAEPTLAPTAN